MLKIRDTSLQLGQHHLEEMDSEIKAYGQNKELCEAVGSSCTVVGQYFEISAEDCSNISLGCLVLASI